MKAFDKVKSLGDEVSSEDLDVYRIVNEENRKSEKLKQVLDSWCSNESQDRTLRSRYAGYLLLLLGFQVLLIDAGFFLVGFNILVVEPWVVNTFILSSFAEITGLVIVIVRYLFPDSKGKLLDLINHL